MMNKSISNSSMQKSDTKSKLKSQSKKQVYEYREEDSVQFSNKYVNSNANMSMNVEMSKGNVFHNRVASNNIPHSSFNLESSGINKQGNMNAAHSNFFAEGKSAYHAPSGFNPNLNNSNFVNVNANASSSMKQPLRPNIPQAHMQHSQHHASQSLSSNNYIIQHSYNHSINQNLMHKSSSHFQGEPNAYGGSMRQQADNINSRGSLTKQQPVTFNITPKKLEKGLMIINRILKFSFYKHKSFFFKKLHSVSLSPVKKPKAYNTREFQRLEIELSGEKEDDDDDDMENAFQEILSFNALKSIIVTLESYIKKSEYKKKAKFFANTYLHQCVQSIDSRKKFFYLKKLLVLRNIMVFLYYKPSLLVRKNFIYWRAQIFSTQLRKQKFRAIFSNIILKRSGSSQNNKIIKYLYFRNLTNTLFFKNAKHRLQTIFIKNQKILNYYLKLTFVMNKVATRNLNTFYNKLSKNATAKKLEFYKEMVENIEKLKVAMRMNCKNVSTIKSIVRFEYDLKEIDRNAKAALILFNLFYINVNKIRAIKKWHTFTMYKNVEDIHKISYVLKEDIWNIKYTNFFYLLKQKIGKKLKNVISLMLKKISRKEQNLNFPYKLLYLENYYNNKLIQTHKGFFKLHRLSVLRKKFIMHFQSKKNSFVCNKIVNYFNLWKLVCQRVQLFTFDFLKKCIFLASRLDHLIYLRKISILFVFKLKAKESKSQKSKQRDNIFELRDLFYRHEKRFITSYKYLFIRQLNLKAGFKQSLTRQNKYIRCFQGLIKYVKHSFLKKYLPLFIVNSNRKYKANQIRKSIRFGKGLNIIKRLTHQCIKEAFVDLKKNKLAIFKEVKKIDYHIMHNTAVMNKQVEKEITKKSRTLKIFNFFLKYQRFHIRAKSINSLLSVYDYFQKWQTKILLEKSGILQHIYDVQQDNDKVRDEIHKLDDNIETLAEKINEMTVRAEKCTKCKQFVMPAETSVLNASITGSIRNEESSQNKINTITNLPVKKLILDKKFGIPTQTSQDDVVDSEFKAKNESPSDFFLERNQNTTRLNEQFLLDESSGGQEYYNYLQKTNLELNNKIANAEYEYEDKINDLKQEIQTLLNSIETIMKNKRDIS